MFPPLGDKNLIDCPEKQGGAAPTDVFEHQRVDIYQLGMIIKRLLENKPTSEPEVSDELMSIIASMTESNPKKRVTASEILKHPFVSQEIEKFIEDLQNSWPQYHGAISSQYKSLQREQKVSKLVDKMNKWHTEGQKSSPY